MLAMKRMFCFCNSLYNLLLVFFDGGQLATNAAGKNNGLAITTTATARRIDLCLQRNMASQRLEAPIIPQFSQVSLF